jgi:hypothetical protein
MSEQHIKRERERDRDGGPANPTMENVVHYRDMGLTVRDYFAAAALQGLMAQVKPEDHWAEYRAKWSYEVADAMLERRKR